MKIFKKRVNFLNYSKEGKNFYVKIRIIYIYPMEKCITFRFLLRLQKSPFRNRIKPVLTRVGEVNNSFAVM